MRVHPEVVPTDEFAIPPRQDFEGRPTPRLSQKSQLIICGGAGTGKSVFLKEALRRESDNLELIISLDSQKLSEIMAKGKAGSVDLWDELRKCTPLPSNALSYALGSRPLLLVIEDIHVAGLAKDCLNFITLYLNAFHREAPKTKIVLTTRETVRCNDLGPEAELIQLEPLKVDRKNSKYEPQDFFINICKVNQIAVDFAKHGEALGNAFGEGDGDGDERVSNIMRTPLFVVICAWLVCRRPGTSPAEILGKDLSEIFDWFIDELYRRANKQVIEFTDIYQKLARQVWPDERFSLHCAMEECGEKNIEFMLSNSFLISVPRQSEPCLAFPHQSLGDFLVAKWMVANDDFSVGKRKGSHVRRDEVSDFIAAFLLRNNDIEKRMSLLLRVASGGLKLFVLVIDRRPQLLSGEAFSADSWARWFNDLAGLAAEWTQDEESCDFGLWQVFHKTLRVRWQKWDNDFCSKIASLAPSGSSVVASIALEREVKRQGQVANPVLRMLREWFSNYEAVFVEYCREASVQQFLLERIGARDESDVIRERAFRTVLTRNDLQLSKKAAESVLSFAEHVEIAKVIEACGPSLSVDASRAFARAASTLPSRSLVDSQVLQFLDKLRRRNTSKVDITDCPEIMKSIEYLLCAEGPATVGGEAAFSLAWHTESVWARTIIKDTLGNHVSNLSSTTIRWLTNLGGRRIWRLLGEAARDKTTNIKRKLDDEAKECFGGNSLLSRGDYTDAAGRVVATVPSPVLISRKSKRLEGLQKPDASVMALVNRALDDSQRLPSLQEIQAALLGFVDGSNDNDPYVPLNSNGFAVFAGGSGGLICASGASKRVEHPKKCVVYWTVTEL